VRSLGYVAEADVPVLYNGARSLLYPTLYEGFGLPPVEMMACGGAVVASTAPPIVETVGRKACLIDPTDEAGWRQALLRVCQDDDYWGELRQGVEELARPFTWERCASDTVAAYARALASPARKAA
jgi:alpha-1,3-rhamnosyl/mannosyltransferase